MSQNHAYPHQPQVHIGSEFTKPIISIPVDKGMNQSEEYRIRFNARHAASDYAVAIEAHKDHKIAQLKRYLIEFVSIPFPIEDGRCKIMAVCNKLDLLPDEPIANDDTNENLKINRRYLGGSIDDLTLGEYGLGNGDYLMFIVTFPQLFRSSANV